MSRCEEIKDQFSGYFDNTLTAEAKMAVSQHVAQCMNCASEYRDFARTIEIIRAIPAELPVMNLWPEFELKMIEIEAEKKAPPILRFRRSWDYLLARLSEGVILYTHGLALKASHRLSRYVIHDPFSHRGG